MQWILMVVGGLLGLMVDESLSGGLIGALLGIVIGQAMALRGMKTQIKQLGAAIDERTRRASASLDVLHKRLLKVEDGTVRAAAPAAGTAELAPDDTFAATEFAHTAPFVEQPDAVDLEIEPVKPPRAVPAQPAVVATDIWRNDAASAPAPIDTSAPADEFSAESLPESTSTASTASTARVDSQFVRPSVAEADADIGEPRGPSFVERAVSAAKDWLFGGNTVLRVGVVLLFIGLAFLLRYASERVAVPVELRYAGVALAAIVLLVLGWRLREKRAAYGLMLQGTGIAVLYLTIFAAMRLHPLITPGAALALLVVVTICLAMLAVLQNAMSLAVAAVLGGFAAPILTSTGSGNHVALFSYFVLLNAGIFAIAWFKTWRLLNLVGFFATFGIGFAWGMKSYQPELFYSTEPFLIVLFLMYVGIGLLFARRKLRDAGAPPEERQALLRWSAKQADYIDATVLFGPPIVGFGLQCALIQHIEFGMAFSALVLGLFYMGLAVLVKRWSSADRTSLLMEVYLALGVIFGTLAIPLALDARWTSAAWAVEGAGIYWLGLRQQRRVARLFALCLQAAAAFALFVELRPGTQTLLEGAPLGALMVGAALLFSFMQLRRAPREQLASFEPLWLPVLAVVGLGFLYLIAPLLFWVDYTAIAWAVAGVVTLYVGLRLYSRSFLFSAFAIQILGGLMFFLNMNVGEGQGGVLASGWQGLMTASLIGVLMIGGMVLALRDPQVKQDRALVTGVNVVLLIGLVFINLAVLFVLPWRTASAVWGVSGLLILWLAMALQQRLSFYFGLALQVIGGVAFLMAIAPSLLGHINAEGLRPLAHSGFWTPALLSLAAMVGAWRLRKANTSEQGLGFAGLDLHMLSTGLLVWGALWWAFAVLMEIARFIPDLQRAHVALIVASATVLVWMWIAQRVRWRELANLCLALTPCAALALFSAWQVDYEPIAHFGWVAWPLLFAVHLATLRWLPPMLSTRLQSAAHVLGCWLLLGVLSLEMRALFVQLADQYNAWRWLGWALVPSVYLLLMASRWSLPWPVRDFAREYRFWAAAPVALVMLGWFWLANLLSDGTAKPLPYLPIVNPLEIGLLIALFALYRWSGEGLAAFVRQTRVWLIVRQAIAGASLFALLTMAVCRAAHHLFGVPFDVDALGNSMLVQAGLSLVWTLFALALTIAGTRLVRRDLWMVGAVLVAIVVVKMFFFELGNSGSLERIISFIGVGVLLLVVGYFSPLPPKRAVETAEVA